MLKRIFLFGLVNILVIALLTFITSFFGLDTAYLKPHGLDIQALVIFSLIWGMAGSLISLFMSKQIAKWTFKLKPIKTPQNSTENFVYETVRKLASQNSIKMPEVAIYQSKEVNAFATGATKNNSLVAISAGLLDAMTEDEAEGVIAHEMAHIVNGDMVTMTLLQGVMNAFVIALSRIIAHIISARDERLGGFAYIIVVIVLQIALGMLASVVVSAFSRRREFAADMGSAQMSGKRKMIAALQRLQQLKNRIDPSQKSFATLKISDRPSTFMKLFSTHPPLQRRIESLQNAAVH